MNVAEIATYDEWAKLADMLGGREPTPSELIDAMVRSYERTFEARSVPDAFESEEGFKKWLKDFSSGLRENEKSLYEAALPAYRAVEKSLSKKK